MRRLDVELTQMPILRAALAAMAVWDHTQGRGSDALLFLAFVTGITLLVGIFEVARDDVARSRGEQR